MQISWLFPIFIFSLTFNKIPWLFPDLEFPWLFLDRWTPCRIINSSLLTISLTRCHHKPGSWSHRCPPGTDIAHLAAQWSSAHGLSFVHSSCNSGPLADRNNKNLTQKPRKKDIVQCRYNTVNFLQNSHRRHSMARMLGWDMRCLLRVQSLIYVLLLSLQRLMLCHVILDLFIMAPNCTITFYISFWSVTFSEWHF